MELLKKNWGVIAYLIACLLVATFIVTAIRRASRATTKAKGIVANQADFFKKVKRQKYTLSKNNLAIAQDNEKLVGIKFRELRTWLAQHYSIPRDGDSITSVECMRQLQEDIRKMHEELNEKVIVGPKCKFFSFDKIASSRILPPASYVPAIRRNLKIVQEIVRLIREAKVKQVTAIDRLMNLETRDEDFYTITPIGLVVLGTPQQIQDMVNLFQTKSRYLFSLKNIKLESKDQAPGGVIASLKDNVTRGRNPAANRPGEDAMMAPDMNLGMDPGMAPEMWGGAGRRPQAPSQGAQGRNQSRGAKDGKGTPPAEQFKTDLVVFQSRQIAAELRFDLIEFLQPEVEGEN